jgi:glycine oxidase
MLAAGDLEPGSPLFELGQASAAMYPEFILELQDEYGIKVDLRDHGTIVLNPHDWQRESALPLPCPLAQLEPGLTADAANAVYLEERSLDPRLLVAAVLGAIKHRGIDLVSGTQVQQIASEGGSLQVTSARAAYSAPIVINCAGAWAGQLSPQSPTRPVKGQMLSIVGVPLDAPRHVVRSSEAYLIPRGDGRIVIGATVEEAGYDKRTDPDAIKRMLNAAVRLFPALAHAKMLEAWAGLRPGTADDLPILGATDTPGHFVATGHYRDGILLAPITAQVMTALILGETPQYDLTPFSPARFRFSPS